MTETTINGSACAKDLAGFLRLAGNARLITSKAGRLDQMDRETCQVYRWKWYT